MHLIIGRGTCYSCSNITGINLHVTSFTHWKHFTHARSAFRQWDVYPILINDEPIDIAPRCLYLINAVKYPQCMCVCVQTTQSTIRGRRVRGWSFIRAWLLMVFGSPGLLTSLENMCVVSCARIYIYAYNGTHIHTWIYRNIHIYTLCIHEYTYPPPPPPSAPAPPPPHTYIYSTYYMYLSQHLTNNTILLLSLRKHFKMCYRLYYF